MYFEIRLKNVGIVICSYIWLYLYLFVDINRAFFKNNIITNKPPCSNHKIRLCFLEEETKYCCPR